MTFQEYPKWVYPAGIKDTYEPGEEPYLVHVPPPSSPELLLEPELPLDGAPE